MVECKLRRTDVLPDWEKREITNRFGTPIAETPKSNQKYAAVQNILFSLIHLLDPDSSEVISEDGNEKQNEVQTRWKRFTVLLGMPRDQLRYFLSQNS
jgi:hypothetical protein